jgi:hypothetical protein
VKEKKRASRGGERGWTEVGFMGRPCDMSQREREGSELEHAIAINFVVCRSHGEREREREKCF